MTPFVQSVTSLFSTGALVINLVTLFLIIVLVSRLMGVKALWVNTVASFVSKHALTLMFLVAFVGTAGSLFYSNVAGFIPCKFCWYARLLLFPQVVIFAIAWYRSWMHKVTNHEVILYGGVLSLIGSAVTFYHYYGQRFSPGWLASCEAAGISCSKLYFVHYGYITLPFMAFSIFALLTTIALMRVLDR
ncbi:MAG: disulfide bond formation protein B [bacterium]|nr:disulfide bond formation protein B [bacterium]